MGLNNEEWRQQLGRYRPYLRLIARVPLDPRLRRKVDPSDVVQDALILAFDNIEQFKGTTPGEFMGWLSQILTNALATEARKWNRPGRDVKREQAVSQGVDRSSQRLDGLLRDTGLSPDQQAQRAEQLLRLAEALDSLPEDERSAIEMNYLDGLTIENTARVMERSRHRVTRLIRNGLKKLSARLGDC